MRLTGRLFCARFFLGSILVFPAAFGAPSFSYKRAGRNAVADIAAGRVDAAVRRMESFLEKHPGDCEALFCLAAAWTSKGDLDKAFGYVREAVASGLPLERFVAGPRRLFAPLLSFAPMADLLRRREIELLHGPLLGCVSPTSASFWVRTAHAVPISVKVFEPGLHNQPVAVGNAETDPSRDYTAVVRVSGLKPATSYEYEIVVAGKPIRKRWTFRTYPPPGTKAKVRIGFGGGAGYTPWHERIWTTIKQRKLDAFLFLGDNVYIDHPTQPEVQRYCYYRRQGRPEFRAFTASTPVYAIWDDHDFTTNDNWGGPQIDDPPWKRRVWEIFKENWNNPAYGSDGCPGCWFAFSIDGVDFILLDGRYYRENPRNRSPSMLGPVQKRWLFRKLKTAAGVFKVLASPVPWAEGTKPGSRDTWDGYREEREEIFRFLERGKTDGVVLLSADRHRSDVWRIPRERFYDLYEFESSHLTNVHRHRTMKKALFSYNGDCSFGEVEFDTRREDPTVTYRIITINGEVVHEFKLPLSKLRCE